MSTKIRAAFKSTSTHSSGKVSLPDSNATRTELDALIAKAKECTKADLFVRHGSYVPLIASAARNNVQPPDEAHESRGRYWLSGKWGFAGNVSLPMPGQRPQSRACPGEKANPHFALLEFSGGGKQKRDWPSHRQSSANPPICFLQLGSGGYRPAQRCRPKRNDS